MSSANLIPTSCVDRSRKLLVVLLSCGFAFLPACRKPTPPRPAPTKPAGAAADPRSSVVSNSDQLAKRSPLTDGDAERNPATVEAATPMALTNTDKPAAVASAHEVDPGQDLVDDTQIDEIQAIDHVEDGNGQSDVTKTTQPLENLAERVLLLTSQGPLIVDLTMWIDDQPFRLRMEQMIDEVMKLGDGNGDGRTTWYELTTSPHFIYGQFGNVTINAERQRQDVARNYDINRNDRVDREEVPGFLSQTAGSSRVFALQTMDSDADPDESAVFQWLDVDGDRRLSKDEIDSAAARLKLFDANDDDTLAASELSPGGAAAMPRRNRGRYAQKSAVLLSRHTDWPALLYLLEERYAFGNPLTPGDFELPGTLFEKLDEDQDQEISVSEISRIREIPAHVAITAAFGAESETVKQSLDLSQVAEDLQSHVEETRVADLISLNIARTKVRISLDDREPPNQAEALMMVWKQADADENKYLDESEFAQVAGFFNVPFAAVDANSDEQVIQDEALIFLTRRQAAARSRLQASAGTQPDSLLSYLDRDSDRRLSARELRSIPERLSQLNADQNEFIDRGEVPIAMSLRISRGVAANQPLVARGEAPLDELTDDAAPTWFTQMDTNRDGELSPKEFLGTPETFGKLDANQDGFVESGETNVSE